MENNKINYPDTPDGLHAKELNAWSKEQGRIITEQILKQNEMKDINEIIDELREHPDYVAGSVWTIELVKEEIYNRVEIIIEEEDNIEFFINEIYKRNSKKIYRGIDYCYDFGFENNHILDDVNIEEEIKEIRNDLKNNKYI